MPLGSLSVGNTPVPIYAPPYTTEQNAFTGLNIITVFYRTSFEKARALIPDMLELEDEPLSTAMIIEYGMSTAGAYTEYVHQIEVTYKGEKFDYCVSLILNNESAIFSGREQFGYPKRFGQVTMQHLSGSAIMTGTVERPIGQSLIKVSFSPDKKIDLPTEPAKRALNLRVIPSPIAGSRPSVSELIPVLMDIQGGDLYAGKGSITFPQTSEFDPVYLLPVVRYEGATYWANASAQLQPPDQLWSV